MQKNDPIALPKSDKKIQLHPKTSDYLQHQLCISGFACVFCIVVHE